MVVGFEFHCYPRSLVCGVGSRFGGFGRIIRVYSGVGAWSRGCFSAWWVVVGVMVFSVLKCLGELFVQLDLE